MRTHFKRAKLAWISVIFFGLLFVFLLFFRLGFFHKDTSFVLSENKLISENPAHTVTAFVISVLAIILPIRFGEKRLIMGFSK